MNRRQALKNIGLGAGFLVMGPTTLSLLQSCKNGPDYDWEPTFLSASNGFIIKEVLEIILPKTDTPGANDLNLAQFIDSYMDQVASKEDQEKFKKSAEDFARAFQQEFDKDTGEGTSEDFDKLVKKYLKVTPSVTPKFVRRTNETEDPMDEDPDEKIDFDGGALSYLQIVRELGIWAWKNSEAIGEEVLWYDPIPAQYIACGGVDELSNNRAMSL